MRFVNVLPTYIILLATALSMVSCRSQKKTVIDHTVEQTSTSSDTTTTTFNVSDDFKNYKEYVDSIVSNTDLTIVIYDTEKPVDQATGKPPVLAEIQSHSSETEVQHGVETEDENVEIAGTVSSGSETQTTVDEGFHEEKQKVVDTPWYYGIVNFFLVVGVLVVIYFIAKFAWKHAIKR